MKTTIVIAALLVGLIFAYGASQNEASNPVFPDRVFVDVTLVTPGDAATQDEINVRVNRNGGEKDTLTNVTVEGQMLTLRNEESQTFRSSVRFSDIHKVILDYHLPAPWTVLEFKPEGNVIHITFGRPAIMGPTATP